MNDIVKSQNPESLAVQPSGISGLMQMAVQGGMDPAGLERLFDLYERDQKMQAAKAYAQALLDFQAEAPAIIKNKTATVNSRGGAGYSYDYASLDHVVGVIKPILLKHGLTFRFDSEAGKDEIRVACVVTHIMGHSETTTFTVPVGSMAGANAAQQTASALSYARRYALFMAFGLVTTDEDDDGMGGEASLNPKQLAAIKSLLEDSGADTDKFLKWLGVEAIEEIPAARFQHASDELVRKLNAKKRAAA